MSREIWPKLQPRSLWAGLVLAGLLGATSLGLGSCQPSSNDESQVTERLLPEGDGVTDALNDYFLSINAFAASPYEVAYQDLDNDSLKDALVMLQGPDWCGLSGCPLLVFRGLSDNDFLFLSRIERVRQPVLLSESRTNGWRDLVIGTTLKGRLEDVLLSYGIEGYPADASQGQRVGRDRELKTQSAF